jgi:uncharacterized membrane protein YdbT with pleckstrin-like domain
MSYIKSHLMTGEHIIKQAKFHWILFAKPFWWLVITFIILSVGPDYAVTRFILVPNIPLYKIIAFLSFCMVVITGLSAYLKYIFWEFAVTDKRVVLKTGWIRRATLEIRLQRIESIGVLQGFWGRIFNYGTLEVSGIGGSKDAFINYPDPFQLKNILQEQVEKSTTSSV